jgi:hypothetical protein
VTDPVDPAGPTDPTEPTDRDPARRYKDVIGELTAAADALRQSDRARAAELTRQLVDLDAAMVQAELRAAVSRFALELRWEAVVEALWHEPWMTLKPRPRPDPDADPERLDALDREVDLTANEVLDAARHRFPFLR